MEHISDTCLSLNIEGSARQINTTDASCKLWLGCCIRLQAPGSGAGSTAAGTMTNLP